MTVGTINLAWQGGEHDFCLAAVGNLLALEELTGGRLAAIFQRLGAGDWGVRDVRETIRLGLIGGGMKPDDAMKLVKACVDGNPHGLAPSVILAAKIIEVVLIGVPGDEPGKNQAPGAETDQSFSTTTVASDAQPSTASAQL